MSVDRISFNHFFNEVKGILEPKWWIYINPETQCFFKAESIYVAITFNQNSAYINLMVGKESNNIEGMRAFIKEMKQSGIRFMSFGTFSKNRRVIALYRYMQCAFVKETPNYYSDGDSYVEYSLDLDATSRF